MNNNWWGRPRNLSNIIENRKISWLELFSDLVYVVIIHGFVENLTEHFNLYGVISFWVLFLFFFNTWMNMVLYFDLHGEASLRNTIFALLQIVAIGITATFTTQFFEGHYTGFILAYTVNQLIYMYLYLQTMIFDPLHATTTRPYLISYSIAEVFFVGSIFVGNINIQRAIILACLLVFLSTITLENKNFNKEFNIRKMKFEVTSAIMERFGLFTMIVLGESLAGIIEFFMEHKSGVMSYLEFIIVFMSVIGMWFVYYTLMDEREIQAKSYLPISIFRGLHRFLIACLVLESFLVLSILEENEKIYFYLFILVTVAILIDMIVMTGWNIFNTDPIKKNDFIWSIGAILMIVLSGLLPIYVGMLIIDIVLIATGIRAWILQI
ncbi:low temperature requirement protein A [Companilactobacillus metriopterae]|uniref:low temperature requirement protein A n=1 Tax=Companilactobacillus metriopterae TaxID=1909267 RepID=UPI00100BD1B9|nr:low temperature requirement protein A [Companilactobacillus metriopterae]